jgi:hypothetical protein
MTTSQLNLPTNAPRTSSTFAFRVPAAGTGRCGLRRGDLAGGLYRDQADGHGGALNTVRRVGVPLVPP